MSAVQPLPLSTALPTQVSAPVHVIATVSPASKDTEHSLNTLRTNLSHTVHHLSFGVPGMEKPEATPSKTVRIAMPSEEVDLYGDIEKLQEQFKDYLR
mgnify:CR=1 FL=1